MCPGTCLCSDVVATILMWSKYKVSLPELPLGLPLLCLQHISHMLVNTRTSCFHRDQAGIWFLIWNFRVFLWISCVMITSCFFSLFTSRTPFEEFHDHTRNPVSFYFTKLFWGIFNITSLLDLVTVDRCLEMM